jgi:O-acetyl-ADP-ribose deacetylase (regulator of RNase III)
MVVTTSKDLKLKNGMLSKSVLEAAGPSLQSACDNNYPSGVSYGEVLATRGYSLPCKFVYFGCLPDWKNTSDNPQEVYFIYTVKPALKGTICIKSLSINDSFIFSI